MRLHIITIQQNALKIVVLVALDIQNHSSNVEAWARSTFAHCSYYTMFIKTERCLLQQALAMSCIFFERILQIICRFSKKLEFRDSHLLLIVMDPLMCRPLFHKKVNCINRSVWEAVKCIGSLLKVEDNDF
jgi:uncharacterized membrane protein YobD (UPF0266 family)